MQNDIVAQVPVVHPERPHRDDALLHRDVDATGAHAGLMPPTPDALPLGAPHDDHHNEVSDLAADTADDQRMDDQPPSERHIELLDDVPASQKRPRTSALDDGSAGKLIRKETKALDRELAWREILQRPQQDISAFVAATRKEYDNWCQWESARPLDASEAAAMLRDPILRRRILSCETPIETSAAEGLRFRPSVAP